MMMDNKIKVDWNIISQCAIFTSHTDALLLNDKYKIIAEPIGTPFTSRRQNKVLTKPFTLTKIDSFYLFELDAIEIGVNMAQFIKEYDNRYTDPLYHVYLDLKKKQYYVITGYKYGVDFLAYRDDPNFIHSEYLIVVYDSKAVIETKSILSNERISVANKKKLLIAFVDMPHKEKEVKDEEEKVLNKGERAIGKVNYIKCAWLQM